MKSFVLRIISLVVMVAALVSYQVVTVAREQSASPQGGITDSASGNWKDGIYEGEAQGFGGPIRVSVTVKGRRITEVTVLSHDNEDAAYYSQAETLTEEIVQEQSADLDAVSGATYSSNGILDAVRNALEQAV